jgi:undecaprenyl-diphosphatase
MDFILNLDKSLLYYVNGVWTHPWLDVFFPAVTDLHKHLWFQILIIPLMLGLFLWKYRRRGFFVFFCLILSMATSDFVGNHAFKNSIERLRPGDVVGNSVVVRAPYGGFSFTSNHAANMFSLAKFTADMIPPLRIPFYAAAAIVGYSRVYNGVHYPTDVLGGGLLGYLVGWLFSWICRRGLEKYKRKRTAS